MAYCQIILPILLMFLALESARGVSLVGQLGTLTKSIGDDARLECKVRDYDQDVNVFAWYRVRNSETEMLAVGRMMLSDDRNMHFDVKTDETTGTATASVYIEKLRFSDFGDYECEVNVRETGETQTRATGRIVRAENNALQRPVISISQDPRAPREGQEVRLSCKVTNYAGNSLMWFKVAGKSHLADDMISAGPMVVLDQSKYGVTLEKKTDSAVYVLIIKSVRAEDSGKYKCLSQVVGEAWDKNPYGVVTLSIGSGSTNPGGGDTKPPTSGSVAQITNTIGVVTAVQGSDVNLDCVISNRAGHEVTWSKMMVAFAHVISKGSTIVIREHSARYRVATYGDTYRLTIKSVTADDGGKYRCSVFGNSDGSMPMMEGYVLIQPKTSETGVTIQEPLGTKVAQVGDGTAFDCEVKNLGSSLVFWMFSSDNLHSPKGISMGPVILTTNTKYSVKITEDGDVTVSTLYIDNISKREEGIYRCMVKVDGMDYDDYPKSDGFLTVR